jgi:hypothetical protein
VRLTGGQRDLNRQAVGIDDRMNLLLNPPRDRPVDWLLFLAMQAAR